MFTNYVVRGLKAGVVAGITFGVFVALVGNPLVGHAEEWEHSSSHAVATQHGEPAVSPIITGVASIGGGVLWGLLAGALVFGVAFYFLEPSIPGASDTQSYLLGGAGFVTVSGAPWLVLPPQPPGVEQGLPTDVRLFWYAATMLTGAVACGLSGYAYTRLTETHGRRAALVAAVLPFGLLLIPALVVPPNPVEGTVPELLAATFRGFVLFGQIVLWFVLASAHAWFVRRDRNEAGSDPDRFALAADEGSVSAD